MSVRRNIASLLLTQVLTWAASLILLIEAPDRLGERGFGGYAYASAFVLFFSLIAGLGTGTLLTREIARRPDRLRSYVHNAVALKVVVVVGVSAIAMAVAVALGNRGETLALIGIGLVGMALATFNDISVGALAGLEILGKPAALLTAQVYVSSVLGLVVLILDLGVLAFASVFSLAWVIPLVGNRLLLHRQVARPPAGAMDLEVWRVLLRGGIPLMTLAFINLIYMTIDIPILKQISGTETVAWYTLAYRWASIPIFITTATVSAYFPRFSAAGAHVGKQPQDPQFAHLVNRAIRLVLIVSVPAAIGLAMIADELIPMLYTSAYEPAIPLIQILALHIPIAGMDTVLATALVAGDRQNRYLIVSLVAAVLNPIACVVLIQWAERNYQNGAVGTAIATLATELWVVTGALVLRSKGVLDKPTIVGILRCVASGLLIVPVLIAADDLPLPVQVALGMVIYGFGAIAFGAITVAEVHGFVRQSVRAVRARRPGADAAKSVESR